MLSNVTSSRFKLVPRANMTAISDAGFGGLNK
jgi:hypothetical protein